MYIVTKEEMWQGNNQELGMNIHILLYKIDDKLGPVLAAVLIFLALWTTLDNFSMDQEGGWFQDDLSALYLLCTLFLSL